MWWEAEQGMLKSDNLLFADLKYFQVVPTKKFRGFGMAKYLKDHMNVEWENYGKNMKMQVENI